MPAFAGMTAVLSGGLSAVIAGLDPAIHDDVLLTSAVRFALRRGFMDPRVKPGGDV
jgi:hypothetical protein